MPGKKPFFSPFRPKFIFGADGKPQGEHEGESWMALFIDLVYVAMLARLSHFITLCNPSLSPDSFHVIIICFAIFNILFVARLALDEYCNRFFEDDIFHQAFMFFYIFGVLLMVQNADIEVLSGGGGGHRMLGGSSTDDVVGTGVCVLNKNLFKGFSYGFYLTRITIMSLYGAIMIGDKTGKSTKQFMSKVIIFGFSCFLMLITEVSTTNSRTLGSMLLFISFSEVIGVVIVIVFSCLQADCIGFYYPLSYEAAQERLGAFILLVLGESVITMLVIAIPDPTSIKSIEFHYFVNFFGLVLLYCQSIQYFERVQIYQGEEHAAKRGMGVGVLFAYGHSILGFAILILAQGIIQIAETDKTSANPAAVSLARKFLGLGCSMTTLCNLGMYMTHKSTKEIFCDPWGAFDFSMHIIFAVVHYALVFGPNNLPKGSYIVLHALVAFFSVSFEAILEHIRPEHLIKHEHSHTHDIGEHPHGHGHEASIEATYPRQVSKAHGENPLHDSVRGGGSAKHSHSIA